MELGLLNRIQNGDIKWHIDFLNNDLSFSIYDICIVADQVLTEVIIWDKFCTKAYSGNIYWNGLARATPIGTQKLCYRAKIGYLLNVYVFVYSLNIVYVVHYADRKVHVVHYADREPFLIFVLCHQSSVHFTN